MPMMVWPWISHHLCTPAAARCPTSACLRVSRYILYTRNGFKRQRKPAYGVPPTVCMHFHTVRILQGSLAGVHCPCLQLAARKLMSEHRAIGARTADLRAGRQVQRLAVSIRVACATGASWYRSDNKLRASSFAGSSGGTAPAEKRLPTCGRRLVYTS